MNRIADIAITVLLVALVTTLVLPGRQTPAVLKAGSEGFANIVSASIAK